MTIPEAASLVLQSGAYAKGGEIFILDMGEPVKIDDLARNLIRLSGYEPDVDINIEYAIFQHPIVGHGIGAEYTILGTYSHNIFLDIILQGGFIFGGLFIILFIFKAIMAFVNEEDKLFFFVLFCYGFVPLLISGSYLSSMSFWIFLGYLNKFSKIKIKNHIT